MKLYNADCFDVLPTLEAGSIDLVLADPPYGATDCKWDKHFDFKQMWLSLLQSSLPTTPILLFGCEPYSSLLRCSNLKTFKYDWIYHKAIPGNYLNAKKQPLRNHEIISVFYSKQCMYRPIMVPGKHYAVTSGKPSKRGMDPTEQKSKNPKIYNGGYFKDNKGLNYPRSITKEYTIERGFHPTQKPVPLMEYMIKTYSLEGQTVLDFCMGSGTCGVAAANLGRDFIGIEKDPKYFEIAEKRIREAQEKARGNKP